MWVVITWLMLSGLVFSQLSYSLSAGFFSSKALNIVELSALKQISKNQDIYIYIGFPQYIGVGGSRFLFTKNDVNLYFNSSIGLLSKKISFLDKPIVDDGLFRISVSGTKAINSQLSYTIGLFMPVYFSFSGGEVIPKGLSVFDDKYNFIPLVFELTYMFKK